VVGDSEGKILRPGGQAPRVIFDRELDLPDTLRDGKTQHIEGVEGNADLVTLRALHTRFKLAIEQVHEDALLSLFKAIPELLRDLLIRAVV
jgi:hypothetical protein